MVAYSFNARFEMPIREGWKTQTIRAPRKRHARPGELLQLFCGMRTMHCRKIVEDVRCTAVSELELAFDDKGGIHGVLIDRVAVTDLDVFAVQDGFVDAADMAAFWRKAHPHSWQYGFEGFLIEWAMPRAAQAMGVAA